jgi:hypothetical protein
VELKGMNWAGNGKVSPRADLALLTNRLSPSKGEIALLGELATSGKGKHNNDGKEQSWGEKQH